MTEDTAGEESEKQEEFAEQRGDESSRSREGREWAQFADVRTGRLEPGLEGWTAGRQEDWRTGRQEDWRAERLEDWKAERLDDRKTGGLEDWKNGRLEDWKTGRLEGWKTGRLEDRKTGRLEDGTTGTLQTAGRTATAWRNWTAGRPDGRLATLERTACRQHPPEERQEQRCSATGDDGKSGRENLGIPPLLPVVTLNDFSLGWVES